jgi:hypothetical protein
MQGDERLKGAVEYEPHRPDEARLESGLNSIFANGMQRSHSPTAARMAVTSGRNSDCQGFVSKQLGRHVDRQH